MRISDWSSDVCSSDLNIAHIGKLRKTTCRQKRTSFKITHTRRILACYPFLLGCRIGKLTHQLQAVTQADLAQHHAVGRKTCRDAAHTATSSPRATAMALASTPSSAST